MMTRRCTRCGEDKAINKFRHKTMGTGGRDTICRRCQKLREQGLPKGWVTRWWKLLNSRTINGAHPHWKNSKTARFYLERGVELHCTKEELRQFVLENWSIIMELRANGQRPSIDRKDAKGHYEITNMRIISFADNCAKR